MFKRMWLVAGVAAALAGCERAETVLDASDPPAGPVRLEGSYFQQAVQLHWELSPDWNGESFRVYGRRLGDASFLLIAEVTSCAMDVCGYTDTNIVENTTYQYFVSAFDASTGLETDSQETLEIAVPSFTAPPIPEALEVVALDNTNYVRWADNARTAEDFAYYRVYLIESGGGAVLLGETDSEGFLDQLAVNGVTSTYFVTSNDEFGNESDESAVTAGTPRPDFAGELIFANEDDPLRSGFRFPESDQDDPVLSGSSAERHFRLQIDARGWWLAPGPGTGIFPQGRFTTALKCGVASDLQCEDWTEAPTSGYQVADIELSQEFTYMLRVIGNDGQVHYGSIRVTLLGFEQTGAAIMVFDWAYQLQAGNPSMVGEMGG
ncbi:MAG: hypothetical protein BMS9Abin29_2426 [Gemmatimonadota bacterium]|nr:MAG: hypothetical protein BMS9Abin29_2426 [Gemmatimonadota bacterium]